MYTLWPIRVALLILIVSHTSQSIAQVDPTSWLTSFNVAPMIPAPCPAANLQTQTDCFIAQALANNDIKHFTQYLNTAYSDSNRPTPYCNGFTYYACAAYYDVPDAFPILASAGANPNTLGQMNSSAAPLISVAFEVLYYTFSRPHADVNAFATAAFKTMFSVGLDPHTTTCQSFKYNLGLRATIL